MDKVFSKLVDIGAGDFEHTTEYYCSFWRYRAKKSRILGDFDLKFLMPNATTPVTVCVFRGL